MVDRKVRDIVKYSQGWQFVEVRRSGFNELFKVSILRDSYEMQCSARLFKWVANGGWQVFYELPVSKSSAFMAIHPSMPEEQFYGESRDWSSLFDQTAELLWTVQKECFGTGWGNADYGWPVS